MIGIADPYAAYCFDTALAYRMTMLEKPRPAAAKREKRDLVISNGMLLGGFSGVIGDVN